MLKKLLLALFVCLLVTQTGAKWFDGLRWRYSTPPSYYQPLPTYQYSHSYQWQSGFGQPMRYSYQHSFQYGW